MTALTSVSDMLRQATTAGGAREVIPFKKDPGATTANRNHSTWTANGNPGKGVAPGSTGLNPDNTTDGGLKQTDPASGKQKWLVGCQATIWSPGGSGSGVLTLYDRLMHVSGFSGTSTSLQSFSGGSVSRYTGTASKGNQIWVEIYSAIGASAQTLTINFTNDANSASTATVSIGATGNSEAIRFIPVTFGAGDYGVRSIQSVQLGGSTGTAGDFGVTIVRPLVDLCMNTAGSFAAVDLVSGMYGPLEILTGACLSFNINTLSTLSKIQGSCNFLEK